MIVIYLLTKKCNCNCEFCLNTWKNSEIDETENKFLIIDKIKEATDLIVLSGGEPFEYDSILELIDYAYSLGMKIIIQTNGINLDQKIISKIKNKVVAVQVSLEGLEKEHNELTKGNFRKSLNAIRLLKKNGILTMTNFTITKKNYSCIEEYIKMLDELEVNTANFTMLYHSGKALKNLNELEMGNNEMRWFCDKFSKIKTKKTKLKIQSPLPEEYEIKCAGCEACKNEIAVQPNGDITPCPSSNLVLGNIIKENINKILKNEIYIRIQKVNKGTKCLIPDLNIINLFK